MSEEEVNCIIKDFCKLDGFCHFDVCSRATNYSSTTNKRNNQCDDCICDCLEDESPAENKDQGDENNYHDHADKMKHF